MDSGEDGARKDVGDNLTVSRSIRFTDAEWSGAIRCANAEFGGGLPASVVRMALRAFLKKRGYL